MQRSTYSLILAILLAGISNAQPVTWMDNYIDSVMEVNHIPGAATLAFKDGQIIWAGPYGYANREQNIPVSDSTLFLLASVSKTVVATALMQLCEDSLFNLDDDINDYLPFPVQHPAYPDSAITFRRLLTHTSGIGDNWSILYPLVTAGDSPIPLGQFLEDYLTPAGHYYSTSNYPAPPGWAWIYSNVGVALAGYLVEVINPDSLSFDEYCDEHIFAPLGMNESSFHLDDLDTTHIAIPYNWNGMTNVPYPHSGMPIYPCGFLRTSTLQLAHHLMAFAQYGQYENVRILDSSTVAEMRTLQIPSIYYAQCLTWFYENFLGFWVYYHDGSWFGCRTYNGYSPQGNWGVIVLTNGSSSYGMYSIADVMQQYASSYTSITSNLTPSTPPIIIPPGGGSFGCSIEIENQSDSTAVFDVWIDITLPSGSTYGPVILRQNVALPVAGSILRQLAQSVPAGAPAGAYSYNAYVGDYPQFAWSLDYFPFMKTASQGDQGEAGDLDWLVSGWEETAAADAIIIPSIAILQARPNPFNPTTAISYELRAASYVNLKVYDTAGRLVATLVDGMRDARRHEVTFDGSNLASGVYLYKLTAGDFTATEKMVLMK